MLPSGLPDFVGDDEDLARFLTQSNQLSSTGVRANAFLPDPTPETSVSRHGSQPAERLWELGRAVAEESGRKLCGAALFKARAVRAVGLDVVADEPPDRHAVILRWPQPFGDPVLNKGRWKELAQRIASTATACKCPV